MAGAATAVEAARPTPADFRNSRRFIGVSPVEVGSLPTRPVRVGPVACCPAADERLGTILRNYCAVPTKKPGANCPGSFVLVAEFLARSHFLPRTAAHSDQVRGSLA